MKRLRCTLLITLLICCRPSTVLGFTYTWLGVTNDWGTGLNWTNDGGLGRLLSIPTATDDVIIPKLLVIPIFYPVVSTVGTQCKSITFNPAAGMSLTINGSLVVSGAILQQHNNGFGNIDLTITGSGNLSCASLAIGDNSVPSTNNSYTTTAKINIRNLTVSGAITANSASAVSKTNNAVIIIDNDVADCNVSAGSLNITNFSANALSSASISLYKDGINAISLKLTGATPVSIANSAYGSIDFYPSTAAAGTGTSKTTIEYGGTLDQEVFTASLPGLNTVPSVYQHLKFTGSGKKNIDAGSLTISGDWTSTGSAVIVNAVLPTVAFQGLVPQTLTDAGTNSGKGVIFTNVTFQGDTVKTISGAATSAFSVSGTGVLTMAGTSTRLTVGVNGKLTLLSDATGTASVAKIPAYCQITGNVSVQRYFKGGTIANNTRYYRLLSSPVNANNKLDNRASSAFYTLAYLNNNPGVFTAGLGGTANGFTVTNASPTIYLYKENLPASNAAFNAGNYKGLANISGSGTVTVYNDAGTLPNVTATLYAGNGFMLYYAGDNVNNVTSTTALNKQFRVGGQYIDPDVATTTAIGTLNQGNVPVRLWWNNTVNTLSNAVTGFNLAGNPYASTIDWETFSNSSSSAGIYGLNINTTIYTFNYTSKNYGTYQIGGASTNNGSRYIASGQGFFVKAATSGATLTFSEAAKINIQPTGPVLLMGLPAQMAKAPQLLRIKLAKDSVNTDEAAVLFEANAQNSFEPENDAIRINGIANVTSLATYASQGTQQLFINHLHSIDSTTRVKLYVNSTGDAAINTLSVTGFSSLDPRYDAFLIDHYKNDSLQISLYGKYDFNLRPDIAATFGDSRFELVFHKKSGLNYRLLSFTGSLLGNDIQLKWHAQSEQNLTGFTIEKADKAGNYNPVYSLQSNGSGAYTWLDKTPLPGINTYRLKQIDAFDRVTYSNLASVDLTPLGNVASPIMIYPNPAVGQFNLKVTVLIVPNQMLMRLIGLNGQVFISKVWSGNTMQQSVSNLLPGTYIVEVTDNNTRQLVGRVKISKP